MKRDMDLVRQVLMEVERLDTFREPVWIDVEGQSPEVVIYHILLLHEADLVDAAERT